MKMEGKIGEGRWEEKQRERREEGGRLREKGEQDGDRGEKEEMYRCAGDTASPGNVWKR